MKIDYRPDVFDDPEYCGTEKGYCPELYRMDWIWFCHQFRKHGEDQPTLEDDNDKPLKCDECKEHYSARIPPEPLPEGHRLG